MPSVVIRRQIAQILEAELNDVIEIREWQFVWWVHVKGQRPTMVSKAKVKKVHTLTAPGIVVDFELTVWGMRIAYQDKKQTQYENTTVIVARRRWKTLQSKGFRQAA